MMMSSSPSSSSEAGRLPLRLDEPDAVEARGGLKAEEEEEEPNAWRDIEGPARVWPLPENEVEVDPLVLPFPPRGGGRERARSAAGHEGRPVIWPSSGAGTTAKIEYPARMQVSLRKSLFET